MNCTNQDHQLHEDNQILHQKQTQDEFWDHVDRATHNYGKLLKQFDCMAFF